MASIEEANLLFKNLINYEKSVVMAKKYVKYHKEVIKDLKRLEQLEKALKILKDKLVLDIETEIAKENDIELIGYWLVERDTQKLYTIITKEEFELLNEVLGK